MVHRAWVLLIVVAVACTPTQSTPPAAAPAQPPSQIAAPPVPDGPVATAVLRRLRRLATAVEGIPLDRDAVDAAVATGDARLAWYLVDLLRFVQTSGDRDLLVAAYTERTRVNPRDLPRQAGGVWAAATNQLIAWDLPAVPEYPQLKAAVYLRIEPKWKPFFDDARAVIDWRLVTWGGVWSDDRKVGDATVCSPGCIPALDDPALTDVDGGSWYPDNEIVFTVEVGGESVALPRRVMETHEMVNLSLGGRRLGIPYCALCGSAQAYLTDIHGRPPALLRTTGLLSRSNKVTYDLRTGSAIDTFTGEAVSGLLRRRGVRLEQVAVGATTWGAWKAAHPDTKIIAEDAGIGRTYERDPLRDRGPDEPTVPVGPVDPRLPAQVRVVGVVSPAGAAVAFPVDAVRAAFEAGDRVSLAGVEVVDDGGALLVRQGDEELPAHEAFWFAWSQFHPDTLVWTPAAA